MSPFMDPALPDSPTPSEPRTEAREAIAQLARMKPEDDWGDKFYAAVGALWRVVKGSEIPAMPEPPHVVMARLIEDVAWAEAAEPAALDVERLAEVLMHTYGSRFPHGDLGDFRSDARYIAARLQSPDPTA